MHNRGWLLCTCLLALLCPLLLAPTCGGSDPSPTPSVTGSCDVQPTSCGYLDPISAYNDQDHCNVTAVRWVSCPGLACENDVWSCSGGKGDGEPCSLEEDCHQIQASCGDLGCVVFPDATDGGVP